MTEQGGLEQRQTGLSLAGQDVFSSEGFICVLFLAVQMINHNQGQDGRGASDKMMYDVGVIGSGLAGLAAARTLKTAGFTVIVLDKGRRIGGRMATRRADGFLFNHGAQFVTARNSAFSALCSEAAASGACAPWDIHHHSTAYSGQPAMRSLAEYLGQGCLVEQDFQLTSVDPASDHLSLHGTGRDGAAHAPVICRHLILTAPAPQIAQITASLCPEASHIASQASYAPCWTVMFGYNRQIDPSFSVWRGTDDTLMGWISREQSRPYSHNRGSELPQKTAFTLQLGAAASAAQLEQPAQVILSTAREAARDEAGLILPEADYSSAHRWRYAKVVQPASISAPRLFRLTKPSSALLGLAGDWHPAPSEAGNRRAGQRAEDAYLSGLAVAEELISLRR